MHPISVLLQPRFVTWHQIQKVKLQCDLGVLTYRDNFLHNTYKPNPIVRLRILRDFCDFNVSREFYIEVTVLYCRVIVVLDLSSANVQVKYVTIFQSLRRIYTDKKYAVTEKSILLLTYIYAWQERNFRHSLSIVKVFRNNAYFNTSNAGNTSRMLFVCPMCYIYSLYICLYIHAILYAAIRIVKHIFIPGGLIWNYRFKSYGLNLLFCDIFCYAICELLGFITSIAYGHYHTHA